MRSMIRALLAASMLMPIAAQAQAQEGRERGERPNREWGERGGRPQRAAEVGPDAQVRNERPQWRSRSEGQLDRPPAPPSAAGERPARVDWRQQNSGGDRPQWRGGERQPGERSPVDRGDGRWNRGDRPQPGADERRPAFGTPDGNAAPGWRNGTRDPRADGRGWNGGGWNGDRRQADPRQWRDDRGRDDRGWNDRGWNDRGRNDRGWDGRGWNDRGRDDRFGGTWNRGWRNDRRYDWTHYRMENRGAYRLPRYYAPSGWGYGYRRFSVGVSLSSLLFSQNYWIDDPFAYRLPEAYGPYRWVRYYDDALLVDIRSGVVVDVVYDIFD